MTEHICEQDLLLAFDDELSSEEREAVLAHVHGCAECENRWNGLAQLSESVAVAQHRELELRPEGAAAAALMARIDQQQTPQRANWRTRSVAVANTMVAIAAAITCIVMLPLLRVNKPAAVHAPAYYDSEPAMPPGYVSLPYGDPALPLDDATVLPVELSAEDLELMGILDNEAVAGTAQGRVQAEILIGMDGWPRAIRIVE